MEEVVMKPWGYYKVLYSTPYVKVKELVINPGHRLSLQRHFHRTEYWVVVKGTADVIVDYEHMTMYEGDSTKILKCVWHRVMNDNKIPVIIIETSIGSYLEEDDIERTEDDYGRCN